MARVDRFQFKGIASKADIEKIEEGGLSAEYPSNTYEAVHQSMVDNPKEPALSFFMLGNDYKAPFTYNYTELMEHINATANMLNRLGVKKGEAVGMILPNLPETCYAMIAAQTVGVAFPINPLLEKEHLKELMIAAEIKVLVTIGPFVKTDVWEKVEAVRRDVPSLKHVIQVEMNNYLRGIKKGIVGLIKSFKNAGKSDEQQTIYKYDVLIAAERREGLDFEPDIKPEDPAAYFHTGGTTGRPKIAIQTQENICFDCWSTGQNLDTSLPELNFYGGLPLFHVFGAMVTLSLCWAGSGHLVLVTPKGFRGDGVLANFWRTLEYYRINVIAAVPAVYKMLNDAPMDKPASTLKFAISGAAPLPVEVMKEFRKKTGVEILEGYGCTEGACMVAVNPPYGLRKLGSVGFPIPFTEVKILKEAEDGLVEANQGEVGLVCLWGKNVFKGYLEEVHNSGVWVEYRGKRYYNTGDLGKIDQDEYIWLTGRKKELIIRGGHNIDPMTIEEPMYEHYAIEMVAAVGRPDKRVGEVPVLYVQLSRGKTVTADELMKFAQSKISERAAIPKEIIFVDEIPLTTIGKIFKPELCMNEIRKICQQELRPSFKAVDVAVYNSKEKGFTAKISGIESGDYNEVHERLKGFAFPFEIV